MLKEVSLHSAVHILQVCPYGKLIICKLLLQNRGEMFRSLKRALFSGEVLPTLDEEVKEAQHLASPSHSLGASSSSKCSRQSAKDSQTQTESSQSPPGEVTALQEELSSLQKSVTDTLACCRCGQLPRSLPVSSCSRHHHLCDRCSAATLCPSCSSPMNTTTSPSPPSLPP